MRFLFCDDDAVFLEFFMDRTEKVLKQMGQLAELIGCSSGKELVEELEKARADGIFLDIDMPGISGFQAAEIAGSRQERPAIIFVSQLDHLVYDSFEYSPFWFLRKNDMEELPKLLRKLVKYIDDRYRSYYFEYKGQKVSALISDILYFESSSHNITLYTQENVWRYKGRIGAISDELEKYHFVRCHVGFLVNCRHISLVQTGNLVLDSGQRIPVSRQRQKETGLKFMEYMRSGQK